MTERAAINTVWLAVIPRLITSITVIKEACIVGLTVAACRFVAAADDASTLEIVCFCWRPLAAVTAAMLAATVARAIAATVFEHGVDTPQNDVADCVDRTSYILCRLAVSIQRPVWSI